MPETEIRAKRRTRPSTALSIAEGFGAEERAQQPSTHLAEQPPNGGAA